MPHSFCFMRPSSFKLNSARPPMTLYTATLLKSWSSPFEQSLPFILSIVSFCRDSAFAPYLIPWLLLPPSTREFSSPLFPAHIPATHILLVGRLSLPRLRPHLHSQPHWLPPELLNTRGSSLSCRRRSNCLSRSPQTRKSLGSKRSVVPLALTQNEQQRTPILPITLVLNRLDPKYHQKVN